MADGQAGCVHHVDTLDKEMIRVLVGTAECYGWVIFLTDSLTGLESLWKCACVEVGAGCFQKGLSEEGGPTLNVAM